MAKRKVVRVRKKRKVVRVKKKTKTYETYNQLYFKGKKKGKPFVYHKRLKAKDEEEAIRVIKKVNRKWNAAKGVKGAAHYKVKYVRVKKIEG